MSLRRKGLSVGLAILLAGTCLLVSPVSRALAEDEHGNHDKQENRNDYQGNQKNDDNSDRSGNYGKFDVQCIADQAAVNPTGSISYHILYHNVKNKSLNKAWLKVKISEQVDIEESGGGVWDAKTRMLQWNLKEVAAGSAGVIHFNLKVKGDAAIGNWVDVSCEGDDGDNNGAVVLTPAVRVKVGTEIHQPAFNGYPDGGFHPHGLLTRAETAAIVSRLEQLAENPSAQSFSDVPATHWARSYIQKVSQAGWMNGSNGQFRPDTPITRAEFSVLLLRIRGIHAVQLDNFEDTRNHWAREEIATARALGYLEGREDGKFYADGFIQREEASKLLDITLARGRLMDGDIKVTQHWPDVPKNAWSFGWVEELSLVAHESYHQGAWQERLVRYLPDITLPF